MSKHTVHCWLSKRDWLFEHGRDDEAWLTYASGDSTCLLRDGHKGPHRWTPDSQIMVTFIDPDLTAKEQP